MTPGLTHVADITVEVAPPILLGPCPTGERRVVPILGGRIEGPRLSGTVLPGGADTQLIRGDGVTEIVACYVLRLDDGALVRVVNRGLRHAAPDDMARLLRGEPVDPARVYFRTAPQFEASAPGRCRPLADDGRDGRIAGPPAVPAVRGGGCGGGGFRAGERAGSCWAIRSTRRT